MSVLTLKEVAERLKCSPSTVRLLINSGKLAAINLGTESHRHYRVTEASLDAFLDVEPQATPTLPKFAKCELVTKRFMTRLG